MAIVQQCDAPGARHGGWLLLRYRLLTMIALDRAAAVGCRCGLGLYAVGFKWPYDIHFLWARPYNRAHFLEEYGAGLYEPNHLTGFST